MSPPADQSTFKVRSSYHKIRTPKTIRGVQAPWPDKGKPSRKREE